MYIELIENAILRLNDRTSFIQCNQIKKKHVFFSPCGAIERMYIKSGFDSVYPRAGSFCCCCCCGLLAFVLKIPSFACRSSTQINRANSPHIFAHIYRHKIHDFEMHWPYNPLKMNASTDGTHHIHSALCSRVHVFQLLLNPA